MEKRGEWMTNETANVIAAVYFLLAGIFTLNFLGDSVAIHASGTAFLIAATYGVVAIKKGARFLV